MSRLVTATTLLAVMAACGSRSRGPVPAPPSNHSTGVAPRSDLGALDPALPDAVAQADVIVEGTATGNQVTVEAVIAGTAGYGVSFTRPPGDLPGEGVYLFEHAASGDVLIPVGGRLALPRDWADAIGAAAPAPAGEAITRATTALAHDIATFRAAAGQPWSPSQQPAVDAASAIFRQLPIAGRLVDDIVADLGEPDERSPDGSIEYVRHQGESGVIRRLRVRDGRVVGVEIHLTQ